MRRPRTAGWCWTTARSEQWWTVARRCCLRGSWRCRESSRQASRSSWSPPVVTSSRAAWWRSRRASCRTCWAGPPGSSASSWASATTARWSTATTWCSFPAAGSAYPAGMTTTDPAPASGAAVPDDVRDAVFAIARRARAAARELAGATRATKDAALHAMADALVAAAPEIVSANAVDLERAQANGVSAGLLDRLTLTVARVAGIADAAARLLPDVLAALAGAGVRLHGDDRTAALAPEGVAVLPATEVDWATEYLSMDLAVRVVDDLEAAIEHIRTWSTGHTEAIVTGDLAASDRFVAALDSAVIMVNASTRFTDGGQFGLGAEIGLSTQKMHARGPMGLAELTTTTWIVHGEGQVRA